MYGGTQWRSWLRHCATSQKVAGSIPDGLLLQSALQPLVGFGLLYDFVPRSSVFTLLSPVSFIFFKSSSTWSSHLSLGLPTGLDEHDSHSVTFFNNSCCVRSDYMCCPS